MVDSNRMQFACSTHHNTASRNTTQTRATYDTRTVHIAHTISKFLI